MTADIFPAHLRIAVLIPCYNEEEAVSQVVQGFQRALPQAIVYVYDNNSRDRTVEAARAAGAVVRSEPLQGKGHVVRRMFSDIEADIYVLCDGDATYDAAAVPNMIEALLDGPLDMVTGARVTDIKAAYRSGHRAGNVLLSATVARIFGNRVNDMLSGYRVFSRRFVKSFPALTSGFEIETELTVHALELRMPTLEIQTAYKDRPPGSVSKLSTFRDGCRIALAIFVLMKEERPLQFFSLVALFFVLVSGILITPIVVEFIEIGLVPRLPTAVLAMGLVSIGFLSLACGMILDTVTRGRREIKRMHYLSIPATWSGPPRERGQ